jgi:hypothetical protein
MLDGVGLISLAVLAVVILVIILGHTLFYLFKGE